MRGYIMLLLLSCFASMAVAGSETSAAAASAVKAIPSPDDDYRAALKAYADDDMMEAGVLFRRAAERGHAAAQAALAAQLDYATDYQGAFKFYKKSAEQGYSVGQYGLGLTYARGGNNRAVDQDFAEARKWIILAADQGYQPAIFHLFDAYTEGGLGLDEQARNGPDAAAWIKRTADLDHVPAIRLLASAYRSGKYGLEVDLKQADILDARANKLSGKSDQKTKKRR